jgi:hypothetical protein
VTQAQLDFSSLPLELLEKLTRSPVPNIISADSGYFDASRPIASRDFLVATLSKAASLKSKISSKDAPVNRRAVSSKSVSVPSPVNINFFPIPSNDPRISGGCVFQLFKRVNPSLSTDERMCLLEAIGGVNRAIFLAAIHRWKLRRPLQELLAAMSECGKNYTPRSATHKQLSGSSASSRKRSSGV